MKLYIQEDSRCQELTVRIECERLDSEVEALAAQIKSYGCTILGKKDGVMEQIRLSDIYYIEAVDGKTYIYCEKDVFQSDLRLYECEEKLAAADFVRASKSCILNLSKVERFRSTLNRKIEVYLENGEKVEINRTYVAKIRERLKGGV